VTRRVRALLSKAKGGADTLVLEDVDVPQPGAGQVRLRVHACGLGLPDTLIIDDQYQMKPPRPFAPGGEVAGVVDAVGPGATRFTVGERVIALSLWGGLAEQLVVDEKQCIAIPGDMPMDEAAALLVAYGTAHYALRELGQLKAGDTLLVTGAAGGVGVAAIELGKAWGARVIAAVSSQDKLDFALAHGASAGVVYPAGGLDKESSRAFAQSLKQVVGGEGANVVLDVVGGDYAEACVRTMAWQGRFLVVGFAAGVPRLPLNVVLLKGCQVLGVSWGEFIRREPARFDASVRELLDMYKRGLIRPRISQRFPLERGGEALGLIASRQAQGKLVVTMD
jgi:NADPH2:quinone reductase